MKPFRTILFAADFSENSNHAFHAACSLAVEDKTRLFVQHVADRQPGSSKPFHRRQPTAETGRDEPDEARREALMEQMRKLYSPQHPVDVGYRVTEGDPAAEILRFAHEINSDLIVMGTHGRTLLRRLLAGSVATAVMRGARCPVMVLRSNDHPPDFMKLRVIVHPTDFSQRSEAALQVARSLARDRGVRLVLLHVAPIYVSMEIGMEAEVDLRYLRNALEAARDRVDGPDLKFPVETWFSRGVAADEIIRVADEIGCGLIVMGTHGRIGLGRLLFGNTAESVLPAASCPVIIVNESQPESTSTSNPIAARPAVIAI